mmetsp:Transcript_79756/g.116868  ORF Transcript_79756/g.116868 Transcript_79756/m.116868 type:complete len:240 (+) Transcript_79756:273-992(+)
MAMAEEVLRRTSPTQTLRIHTPSGAGEVPCRKSMIQAQILLRWILLEHLLQYFPFCLRPSCHPTQPCGAPLICGPQTLLICSTRMVWVVYLISQHQKLPLSPTSSLLLPLTLVKSFSWLAQQRKGSGTRHAELLHLFNSRHRLLRCVTAVQELQKSMQVVLTRNMCLQQVAILKNAAAVGFSSSQPRGMGIRALSQRNRCQIHLDGVTGSRHKWIGRDIRIPVFRRRLCIRFHAFHRRR